MVRCRLARCELLPREAGTACAECRLWNNRHERMLVWRSVRLVFALAHPALSWGDCEKNFGVVDFPASPRRRNNRRHPAAGKPRIAAKFVCGENDERRCIQVKWCVALLHTTPHLYRSPSGPERTRSLRRGGRAARNDTEAFDPACVPAARAEDQHAPSHELSVLTLDGNPWNRCGDPRRNRTASMGRRCLAATAHGRSFTLSNTDPKDRCELQFECVDDNPHGDQRKQVGHPRRNRACDNPRRDPQAISTRSAR